MLPFFRKTIHFPRVFVRQASLKSASVKCLSTDNQQHRKAQENTWTTIYKLPIIQLAAALNRIKLYQAGFTALSIPASYAAESAAILSDGSFLVVSALGITGTATLIITSYFTRNLIGFVYVDSSLKKFRISYIDFWGTRKNLELQHDEIEPPADDVKLNFLSTVKTNGKGSYKLLRRMGHISDYNIFAYYFGE